MKAPCHSYFGSRSRNHGSGQRGGERQRIDFCEATQVIEHVIAFTRSLLHMMNNCQNTECQIKQCENRRTGSGSLTTPLWSQSPIPQLLKPLPPPGVGAYHPPMIQDLPLHLNSNVAPKASAAFTPSAHRVDSHCKAAKPSHDVLCADSLTQVILQSYCEAAVGLDLDLSQENSEQIEKIPENSEKISGNSQSTSYGDILDPTLHSLALALPLLRDWPITSYSRS